MEAAIPTPLESQILDVFEEYITESEAIPEGLVKKFMAHVRSDRTPTAEVLLETIQENLEGQSE